MFELTLLTVDPPGWTAPQFPEAVWGARRMVRIGEGTVTEVEPIVPDSDVPMNFVQMADALRAIGTPSPEGTDLAVDPDDYPLF